MYLVKACARSMVPVTHFEDHTVSPTSMLHEIIYSLAYPKAGRNEAQAYQRSFALLVVMLGDLTKPHGKYTWAQQVSILLFRTIIGEDVTGTQMRTPLELAQFLGLDHATLQLAYLQKTLCTSLFNEPKPNRINFPLEFLRREVPLIRCLWRPKCVTMLIV